MQLVDRDRFLTSAWIRNARQDRDCEVAIDYLISHLRIYLGIVKLGHQLARRVPYRDGHSCTLNGLMSREFFWRSASPPTFQIQSIGGCGMCPSIWGGGDWTHHTAVNGEISKDMQCYADE